jgi:hypothetical protein
MSFGVRRLHSANTEKNKGEWWVGFFECKRIFCSKGFTQKIVSYSLSFFIFSLLSFSYWLVGPSTCQAWQIIARVIY